MKLMLSLFLFMLTPNQVDAQSDTGKDDIIEEDGSLGTFRIQTNKDLERGIEIEQERQEDLQQQRSEKDKALQEDKKVDESDG
jgi:hypothetical protein